MWLYYSYQCMTLKLTLSFINKYQLSRIFLLRIFVDAFCSSVSISWTLEPSCVIGIGGNPGYAWVWVKRNLTIKFISSKSSSPLTKLDVFGSISSTNWFKLIPYKVSSKLMIPLPGIFELWDNKNK